MDVPVGTINTIFSLLKNLIERVKDRKIADEISKIQSHILSLQIEDQDLREKNLALTNDNTKLANLNEELKIHVERLRVENQELIDKVNTLTLDMEKVSHNSKSYKTKWGCLAFEDDVENLYCPNCYISFNKKIPTSRIDFSRRFCSGCKTEIPSG